MNYMYDLINAFPGHLLDALAIGGNAKLGASKGPYSNVVITGLGGSGIGGRIVAQLVADEAICPIDIYNNYYLPAYVGKGSLVITCSYSGDTEETLSAMSQAMDKGAHVVAITSGGTMLKIAKAKGLDHIVIPGGNPPRTMLAYSFTQLFFVLKHFGIIELGFEASIARASQQLTSGLAGMQAEAKALAQKLHGKRVVVYSEAATEAVAIRFRQQLNENSKELCWHHAIPEMNHNELVGWAGGDEHMAVVIFRHKDDQERSQLRIEINKTIIAKYTPHVFEAWSKGEDRVERQIYLIHLGDWITWYLAEEKGVDSTEIKVIDTLKAKLSDTK